MIISRFVRMNVRSAAVKNFFLITLKTLTSFVDGLRTSRAYPKTPSFINSPISYFDRASYTPFFSLSLRQLEEELALLFGP